MKVIKAKHCQEVFPANGHVMIIGEKVLIDYGTQEVRGWGVTHVNHIHMIKRVVKIDGDTFEVT